MDSKVLELSLKIGNDNGNSEHDIIINGYQIMQPNVYSKVRKLPLLDEINPKFVAEHIEDNLIVTVDSPSAAPGIYYVGNYALNSGERVRSIEVGADNNKLDSELIVINTLAQIAGQASKMAYLKDPELCNDIKVNVDMSTSLPIGQYTKSKAELFSDKFMNNSHRVTVQLGLIRANVLISFNYVKTLPEGVTAVHAFNSLVHVKSNEKNTDEEKVTIKKHNDLVDDFFKGFNQKYNKSINGSYFKDKKILHIAIGEGTTEYPITTGIIFDPNFIKGSNNGIGHAIDRSLDEFKNELGLLNYTRQKYSEVLRDKKHKFNVVATDIIKDYIEEEAEDILHYAKGEIQKSNNEVDVIAVYGGGSILMREKLSKKLDEICEKANIELLYVDEKYAVILESLGLYEFTIGKIFTALKNRNNTK